MDELKSHLDGHHAKSAPHGWTQTISDIDYIGNRIDQHKHEDKIPKGVKVYQTDQGEEYYFCIKMGKTVWSLNEIEKEDMGFK